MSTSEWPKPDSLTLEDTLIWLDAMRRSSVATAMHSNESITERARWSDERVGHNIESAKAEHRKRMAYLRKVPTT